MTCIEVVKNMMRRGIVTRPRDQWWRNVTHPNESLHASAVAWAREWTRTVSPISVIQYSGHTYRSNRTWEQNFAL